MRGAPDRSPSALLPPEMRFVFKEKLTMKTESLTEEKLECSLWCCLSDPSPRGRRCVLERCIVPWMRQVKSPVQKIVLKDNANLEPRKPSSEFLQLRWFKSSSAPLFSLPQFAYNDILSSCNCCLSLNT
ncbi:putative ubiquitin-conjugating enzyme E2Q2-like protein isoform X1 [Piliocolobus tephrosceles]|uniref:putative ubiquitin-conjugating enzyme E2Q2-like protein isoform X1 n=1 Tax=Piliocolobus tephrosceles TaxID=591936 RepID=UPI000C2ADECF|nr:putative ubiquitin-conjugating enzyme E2Q2-like protein isoform X1 [Piliocolobus tephrosceles]